MQDWEVDSVAQLLSGLYVIKIWLGDDDKLVWLPFPNKGFKVKRYYWKVCVLLRVFFFWRVCVALGRILIVDNLRKRSLSIME